MSRPSFASLSLSYPRGAVHTCTMTFPNTCAVRLSEALAATDRRWVERFRGSGLNTCKHGYMRGAQDLASVLRRAWGAPDLGFVQQADRGSIPSDLQAKDEESEGKRGVVCFMNIPTFPDGQGHIDLWKNGEIVGMGGMYWDAEPIWFWAL